MGTRIAPFAFLLIILAACSVTVSPSPSVDIVSPSPTASATAIPPTATPVPTAMPGGVYAFTVAGQMAPALANLKPLVYVPNEAGGDVTVIDPATFKIIDRFKAGASPEHITPDWDLSKLYVNNMSSSDMTIIDPITSKPIGTIPVPYPYNLYFSMDGSKAIVVDDFLTRQFIHNNGLYFYDRKTWKLIKFLEIPYPGVDHLDFSADGSYMIMSAETAGEVVKVDVAKMEITGALSVGGSPLDVRLDPGGKLFYIANQGTGGVDVVDGDSMKLVEFIKTDKGAHGIGMSRDATRMFVTNRIAGSISVIDLATRTITATWNVGGSPDMVATSIDGSQLWVSNRYNGTVIVLDSTTGAILATIRTGANPHGLAFWPQPGRYSLGHNGNMR
ncbi:MAG: YncE family protein [Chloroflexota bacterium]